MHRVGWVPIALAFALAAAVVLCLVCRDTAPGRPEWSRLYRNAVTPVAPESGN